MTETVNPDREDLQRRVDAITWFHSIDLGNGIVTRGTKSIDVLASEADALLGPVRLEGASVADIGAWNGYFSLDSRRRGAARVLAVDEYTWVHPEFRGRESIELVNTTLRADLEFKQVAIADTGPDSIGRHDVVLFLGVFYHLFDAPADLLRIAGCAKDVLVIESYHDALELTRPAMVFYPGATLANDATNWWGPNPALIRELLTMAGYERIFFRPHPDRGIVRGIYHAFRSSDALTRRAVDPSMPRSIDMSTLPANHRFVDANPVRRVIPGASFPRLRRWLRPFQRRNPR